MTRHLLLAAIFLPPTAFRTAASEIPPDQQALAAVRSGKATTAHASWWGFDPVDTTRSLQAALDSPAKKLIIDDVGSPWIITPIQLPGDKEIVFRPGVIVEAKPGAFLGKSDSLFTARGKRNLTLHGPGATFRMRKADYHKPPYEPAEWRHALSLRGCRNVTIEGLTLADSGGDGIYLGIGADGATNRDITIRGVTCAGNNRQGVSVITAENLLFEDCVFRDTGGTAPQAGIDFEPNQATERLVNCVLRNCRSENNAGRAYHFSLGNLQADSLPISVKLENCSSKGNKGQSLYLGIVNRNGLRSVRGSIGCSHCKFDSDEAGGIRIRGNEADGCRIRLSDCTIIRDDELDSATAPITIQSSRRPDLAMGGIQLENCLVRDAFQRRPLALVASPLTPLRILTGSIRYEWPGGSSDFTLDDSQLMAWFPERKALDQIEPVEFDWHRLQPGPAERSATPAPGDIRLRRSATFISWGRAGVPVELRARVGSVGREEADAGVMTVIQTDGSENKLEPAREGDGFTYAFIPQRTGPVQFTWAAGSRSILRPTGTSSPLSISAAGSGIALIRSTPVLYFRVPGNCARFAILVTGQGTAETVKATIRDQSGVAVAEADNIATPHVFAPERKPTADDEIWSITFARASAGVLEDVTIHALGIPPLFAPSPADLLVGP